MFSYDVILRMDWLTRHLAVINCALKQVTLKLWGDGNVMYIGSCGHIIPPNLYAKTRLEKESDTPTKYQSSAHIVVKI
jgi:hypothetical protein